MITSSQLDGSLVSDRGPLPAEERKGPLPPSVGDRLIYAIGDIHGRLDLLEVLLEAICDDALKAAPRHRPMLILLGDYVDRGAQSAGVLSLLVELCANAALEVRPLRGNHEEALLTFLDNPATGPTWMRFGAAATLASYGVTPPRPADDAQAWSDTSCRLREAMPADHLALLRGTELLLEVEDYLFVHAGLRPGLPINQQSPDDLLWIRRDFLNHRTYFEKRVVHGHSADTKAQVLPWRVGVDTGAYATGILTALRLQGSEERLMHAAVDGRAPPF